MSDNLEIKVLSADRRQLEIRVNSREPYTSSPTSRENLPVGSVVAWGRPETAHVQAYLERNAYSQMMAHARSGTRDGQRVEVGGILLGRAVKGADGEITHVIIAEALPDEHGISRSSTFNFTHEGWAALIKDSETRFPDLRIVGWYHSHPDFGVFFSGTDRNSQLTYFSTPWRVGIVVDPIRDQGKLFAVSPTSREVVELEGFYEPVGPNGKSWISWQNWTRSISSRTIPSGVPASTQPPGAEPAGKTQKYPKGAPRSRRLFVWVQRNRVLVAVLAGGFLILCSLLVIFSARLSEIQSAVQHVQATMEAFGIGEPGLRGMENVSKPRMEPSQSLWPFQTPQPYPEGTSGPIPPTPAGS